MFLACTTSQHPGVQIATLACQLVVCPSCRPQKNLLCASALLAPLCLPPHPLPACHPCTSHCCSHVDEAVSKDLLLVCLRCSPLPSSLPAPCSAVPVPPTSQQCTALRTFMKPSEKRRSVRFLSLRSMPAWCMPMPDRNSSCSSRLRDLQQDQQQQARPCCRAELCCALTVRVCTHGHERWSSPTGAASDPRRRRQLLTRAVLLLAWVCQ